MLRRYLASPRTNAVCAAMRQSRQYLCRRIARAAAGSDEELENGFPALVASVEAGFRREELAMEILRLPQLHQRRADNALILEALHRAMPAVEKGDRVLVREVVNALRDLLELHRLSGDLALTLALSARSGPARRTRGARRTLPMSQPDRFT